jgi:hypothetical protein
MSETMNAVFLGERRKPAGEVSTGNEMRIGRAGASASKKAASSNGRLGHAQERRVERAALGPLRRRSG